MKLGIGVAPFGEQQQSMGELLKRADLAMYQSKSAGRNTLRFFDPATAAEMTRTVHSAPPLLDADGASIRSWLDAEAKVAS